MRDFPSRLFHIDCAAIAAPHQSAAAGLIDSVTTKQIILVDNATE